MRLLTCCSFLTKLYNDNSIFVLINLSIPEARQFDYFFKKRTSNAEHHNLVKYVTFTNMHKH